MINISLAQRIFYLNKSFIFFHTHQLTFPILKQAIKFKKSLDLDISVNDSLIPYLGHSKEYYKKSGEKQPKTAPIWEVVKKLKTTSIPVMIDCKHFKAWPVVEKVIKEVGPHRCLVNSFVSEFKFYYSYIKDKDYFCEWLPIKKLKLIKQKFPLVTTSASAKFLPLDFSNFNRYKNLYFKIRKILEENQIDRISLNIPFKNSPKKIIDFFISKKILITINTDVFYINKLSKKLYIGETDYLNNASCCKILGY